MLCKAYTFELLIIKVLGFYSEPKLMKEGVRCVEKVRSNPNSFI